MFGRHSKSKGLAAAGAKAPGFDLALLDGGRRSLQEILTHGPALLIFYKISCPVCQFSMPYLQRMAANSAIQVIGISQDNETSTRGFLHRFGVTFPTLLDSAGEDYPASNAYGLSSVPALFVVETDGAISRAFHGFSKHDFELIGARAGVAPFAPDEHVPEWKAG